MLGNRSRGTVVVALILFSLLSASARAGLRSRALPEIPPGVEEDLKRSSAALASERTWVVAEVERGRGPFLEGRGVRLLRAIDGDLWLASVPGELIRDDRLPAGLVRVWSLRPEDRIVPGLRERLAARSALAPDEPVNLRVKVFADASLPDVRRAVLDAGAAIGFEAHRLGILDVTGDASLVERLVEIAGVRWIEPAPPPPVDAVNGLRFDAMVNEAQMLGIDGSGVVIGMWDSGVPDSTHPDLAGRTTPGETGLFPSFHSTHVAGIAIGDGTNSENQGGSPGQWRGVATAASIVNWGSSGAVAEVDTAIAVHDIDVSTNSWTYPVEEAGLGNCDLYGDYASDAPSFDRIVTGLYGKRIPVVFAAGNERDDGDCSIDSLGGYFSLPPPGTAKNTITVGAHHSDQKFMAPFSSWGPTDDGRMKPDLTAPGCELFNDHGITSTAGSGLYIAQCGTSQAAPAVTGAIAMLLQEWRARFPGAPLPSTYKALLGNRADDRANPGPDYRFGLGAIQVAPSVVELQTATTIEDEVDYPQVDVWPFKVPPGTDTLRVTLAWDDPAGAELADTTLVNDLDLRLAPPSGPSVYPYVLFPENPDLPASVGVNQLDNVEHIRVISPVPGAWTAIVFGIGVTQGPQKYSLVGIDNRPPADPAAATATGVASSTVELSWVRPGDADRAGTLVVRSTSPVTWVPQPGVTYAVGTEPSPGVEVVVADDVDYSVSPFEDEPLFHDTIYQYAFFGYDEVPNYSPGVADTAQTPVGVVPVPLSGSAPAVVRFDRVGRNPTSDVARFRFELPRESRISIEVYDAAGRRVETLVRGPRKAGSHVVEWNAAATGRAAAGVYFVRFRSAELTRTEKVLIVR